MINSMTGYGSAEGRFSGITYAVEISTVNNRYFKATIRLPEALEYLEGDIEKQLRTGISRGTVNYVLRQKGAPAEALFEINDKALGALMNRLSKIKTAGDIDRNVDMGVLLALPGIMSPAIPSGALAGKIRQKVTDVTKQAIKALKIMRSAEGKALEADLKSHCGSIKKNLEKIRDKSTASPQLYAEKLRKRVDEMLATAKIKIDDQTVAREVAVFADRADISEEIARLDSHLVQFEKALKSNEQSGRKLDFISQEMLREANTIGSKASDSEIVHMVVAIKCSIDRIKEQVQNVE